MNQQQTTNAFVHSTVHATIDTSADTTVDATASMPNAHLHTKYLTQIPDDLYIPPEAFQLLLEYFEGPLDFLLYLVHKNGLNLVELAIAPIATQYLHYIQAMIDDIKTLNIELAADYMVMAASLADIKSRLLLPKPQIAKPEEDPRIDLLSRLQNYAKVKQGALWLNDCQVLQRDVFAAHVTNTASNVNLTQNIEPANNSEPVEQAEQEHRFDACLLQAAMQLLLKRPRLQNHQIELEPVQLEERMQHILQKTQQGGVLNFTQLINPAQGHMGIVVTFMALLELIRQGEVEIRANGIERPLMVEGRQSHAA